MLWSSESALNVGAVDVPCGTAELFSISNPVRVQVFRLTLAVLGKGFIG